MAAKEHGVTMIWATCELFLHALFDRYFATGLQGFIEVRIIGPAGVESRFFNRIKDLVEALPGFAHANSQQSNIYFGVNPRCRERGREEDVGQLVTLHIDVDAKPGTNLDPEEQAKRAGIAPSIVVASGHGLHLYWLLHEPLDVRDADVRARARGLNAALAGALGGDSCHDLSRVLRLPGFANCKDPACPKAVELLSCEPGRRYTLDNFNFLHPTPLPSGTTPNVEIGCDPPQLSNRAKRLLETHETLKLRWAGDPLGLNDTTKSGLDASIAAILAPECTDKEIADAIRLAPYNKDRQHEFAPQYLTRTIVNARAWLEQQRRMLATAPAISPAPQTLTPEEAHTILSDLLFQIAGFLRSYLAISTAQNYVLAIWVFHTHVIEAADRTPYLHVRSPEKRCGKSLVLDLLKLLVRNPWRTSNASAAAIPRKISQSRPTSLFDEADTYIRADDERGETLRGVLDAGFERGGTYSRCVGQGAALKVADFDVFCAKAIAGLRDLPDTIADRSIPIKMKRALPGEIGRRFYRREVEPLASTLRARIEKCAAALVPTLKDARPERVSALNDRQNDIVEPLLAIGDLAGDGWPGYLRDFLRELFQSEDESDQNLGVRLLADTREIFTERGIERLASADLVQALRERPEAPWLELGRGKGLTGHTLARMLRGFGIKPARWWDGKTIRGYEVKGFGDAWARYLPALPCTEGGSTVRASEPTESTG